MHNIYTVLIMFLLGYLAFVFISESPNPFRHSRATYKHSYKKSRRRIGLLIGALLALSSVTVFFSETPTLMSNIRSSLGLAIALIGAVIICLGAVTLYRWLGMRRLERKIVNDGANIDATASSAAVAATANSTDSTTTEDSSVAEYSSDELLVNTPGQQHQLDDPWQPALNSESESGLTSDIDDNRTQREEKDTDSLAIIPVSDTQKEQTQTPIKLGSPVHIVHAQNVSGRPTDASLIKHNAANQSLFVDVSEEQVIDTDNATGQSSVVADDLIDDLITTSAEETVDTHAIDAQTPEVTTKIADTATISNEFSHVDEEVEWPTLDNIDDIENSTAIVDLQTTMEMMSVRTDKIQDAVHRVVAMSSKEAYFRTCLEVAQADHDQAQQQQMVLHKTQLSRSRNDLESEVMMRTDLQTSMEQHLKELKQAKTRVKELEVTLSERHQVFADQMESLEKTRAMARDAAQLARRAAVAQQKARTHALQERAARERLEVSAKKAVDIARNAINKLAEEERRNRA